MKTLNNLLIITTIVIAFYSCNDVFEKDISKSQIVVITPEEGDEITGNTVQFSWQLIDGADQYVIQVVDGNNLSVIDSVVTKNSVKFTLDPGNFKWQVKGQNFAYETAFSQLINFSLKPSSDLSNQTVALLLPSAGIYTNDPAINFTWKKIPLATSYKIELTKKIGTTESSVALQNADAIILTSYSVDASLLSEDAEYIWNVIAYNESTDTGSLDSKRSFYLDRVLPGAPGLLLPADVAPFKVKDVVTFSWNSGANTGNVLSPVEYLLEYSQDNAFNNPSKINSTNTSVTQAFDVAGTFYWRVFEIDKAGNKSIESLVRSIKVE